MTQDSMDIFLVATPGLEQVLAEEAVEAGFAPARVVPGGVEIAGDWATVWQVNLRLRGATRVLVRVGSFRAFHLAQLDKRARKFDWARVLRRDVPVRVETVCRKSKIYHGGAATQRIERAIAEELGAPITKEAQIVVKVRIEDDLVTVSLDSSGEALHKRGHKVAVNKAPMRENLAALLLRACGYDGSEPVLDPMCGSGTFPIEAAEMAAGLWPGRSRAFAFEEFASFDAKAWAAIKAGGTRRDVTQRFYGSDRDAGAIKMSAENAERAGVGDLCQFTTHAISDLQRPEGPAGLVIVNPPYGGRIGQKKMLYGLYASLGTVLKERFAGWRVGIVTTEGGLAKATGLPFQAPGPVIAHGGLKVRLYQTGPLS